MIFFIRNRKNLFLTIFYRFFGYDAQEQKCRSRNFPSGKRSQNFKFPGIFRVIVKNPVLIFFNRLYQASSFTNHAQIIINEYCLSTFVLVLSREQSNGDFFTKTVNRTLPPLKSDHP